MHAPTRLPTLAAGAHGPTDGQACFMEYASLLAGEAWTDSPACTHPVIAQMARTVNDRMGDADRHKLAVLIPSVIGTADLRESALDRHILSVRLAAWCARQVAHLARDRAATDAGINAAVAWADNPCEDTRAVAAYAAHAAAAYANAAAYAYAAAYAAHAANAAAYAANAAAYAAAHPEDAATNAANAAYAAAWHASFANAATDLPALLSGLIEEHARLTGHTPNPVTEQQWNTARALVTNGAA